MLAKWNCLWKWWISCFVFGCFWWEFTPRIFFGMKAYSIELAWPPRPPGKHQKSVPETVPETVPDPGAHRQSVLPLLLPPESGIKTGSTPPKTNMEPQDRWFVDVSPFSKGVFSDSMLVFGSVLPKIHWCSANGNLGGLGPGGLGF